MGQYNIFGEIEVDRVDELSSKIKTPTYTPKNKKPHILELLDHTKTKALIRRINNSEVSEEEKDFLIEAAHRHHVFHYSRIADYYAHASPEMQQLMEESALIIIDFKKAIEHGFVNLTNAISEIYETDQ